MTVPQKTSDKKKVVAIVQARLGSSRLPLKSLLCLKSKPIIDWVVSRLKKSKRIDELIVAIPNTELDKVLLEHLQKQNVKCFTGPENDVLKRFTMAANEVNAETVVRICADNPLVWGEAIDRLIKFYNDSNCDYAYNHIPKNNLWPDGLGAEIISAKLLAEMDAKACKASQREHCFNYIWDNSASYRIATFDPIEDWLRRPDLKFDIDSPEDFQRLALLPINPDMDGKDIIKAVAEQ